MMPRHPIKAGRVLHFMRPVIEITLQGAIERQATAPTIAQWFEDQHVIDDCRAKLAKLDAAEGKDR